MDKIRISAVRYANTYPFIYGLSINRFDKKAIIETDHPADCADKLASGKADIGLIPVAALPMMKSCEIITDYCLGAYGDVRTVLMLSNCPFDEIRTICLDYRSLSSVNLARILARHSWKKDFLWVNTNEGFDFENIEYNEAVVLIGDQCFSMEKKFRFKTDLSGEWCRFTGLPFTFACWATTKKLDDIFVGEFNAALKTGVDNIPDVIDAYGNTGIIRGEDLRQYLTVNIDFCLNDSKRKAIELFLSYLSRTH